eukprot:TRINITY_DN32535_c0_g1_i1.p1 TRINITY_DN32535_c0_g1~~TRINITY_DN32535_c0_g1_i1.p1  ORF type:complete len:142 (+),score=46.58 TRINITY_DN32535_c0_g1_i1:53-427(+)
MDVDQTTYLNTLEQQLQNSKGKICVGENGAGTGLFDDLLAEEDVAVEAEGLIVEERSDNDEEMVPQYNFNHTKQYDDFSSDTSSYSSSSGSSDRSSSSESSSETDENMYGEVRDDFASDGNLSE